MTGSRGEAGSDSDAVLTLEYVDPRDGQHRQVPLRFLAQGDRLLVLTSRDPVPSWVGVVLHSSSVLWRVGTRTFQGAAHEVAEIGGVRAAFEARYGAERVRRWFGGNLLCVGFEAVAEPDYRAQVRALFDAAASEYDHHVETNPLDRLLRAESLRVLQTEFHAGDRVVEIGCGTGLETLPLARAGVRVVGLDPSAGMLERLERKASEMELLDRIETRNLWGADLAALESEFGPGSFQGAFSTFGALNLEPRWREIPPILARLLVPGGRVVLGVWNRVCLSEMILYALAGRPRRALGRLQSPAPAGLTRFGLPVSAFAPATFVRAFSRDFEPAALLALPFALPPYDFWRHVPNPGAVLPLLSALDVRSRSRFPFNRLGDHFVLVLRRR